MVEPKRGAGGAGSGHPHSSKLGAVLVACAAAAALPAHAQGYPAKPIRWIVPFPPGGGTDLVARALSQRLGESSGLKIVVDNRPGGNTVIGAEAAARAAPDGYTVFIGTNTTHGIAPNVHPRLPYDPVRDFAAITRIATLTNLLVVHPSLPVRTVKDLIALARAQPGQLNFASSGNATPPHLAGLNFNLAAGVVIAHVPYKGAGPALTALVTGETHFMFGSLTSTLPHVRTGRLRGIAVTSLQRSAIVPEVPTVAESGLPRFEQNTWYALFAPGATPRAIVERLHAEFVREIGSAEFKAWLHQQGAEAVTSTPEELAAFVKSEIAQYAVLVKKAGMRAE